jgi:hypothetical protein
MSRIKRFAGRFAMGAVLVSSLIAGTSALATGTASAAPSGLQSFHLHVPGEHLLDEDRRVNVRVDVTDVHACMRPRQPASLLRGNTMLRRELPDDGGCRKIGSMSLGGGR